VILLARHGRTRASGRRLFLGRRDVPLSRSGVQQAAALGIDVRGSGLVRLYSSPLSRARQTAEIVGATIGLEPVIDPRLAETDVGRWGLRHKSDVKHEEPGRYRERRRHPERFRFPEGESLAEHQRRTAAALREIAAAATPALVICHHGTIRCALALGHPHGLAAWRQFEVPNARAIELPALCLDALAAGPARR
jgi:probable phosphoglycerate mutase